MSEPLHLTLGLTDQEYERIIEILGRRPNHAELAMYSVMWSEHCSYKSSRVHLKDLPTEGPHVLIGPGEGAGVIQVGNQAVAMRIESHNHPCFVEPVQGAATGIGGVVRDVVSMGARPIALLNSLRFGALPTDTGQDQNSDRNRFLTAGVVSGISSYGNCIGVPTVGGETRFEACYSGNPLVNVMCIGVAPLDGIKLARAPGPGNAVLLLGSTTGRDGIGGVSVLASASFDDRASTKRPSVQVGDPFMEKLLIEGSLALIEKDLVVGIQDLGGAGLCCATSESAARAGTGMLIDLDLVPLREPGMEPYEILTSESQERMLVVVEPAKVEAALTECERLGLTAARIGQVTGTGRLVCTMGDRVVADVPADSLGDGPLYHRRYHAPAGHAEHKGTAYGPLPAPDPREALLKLVACPNIASKRWIWEQFDHQVMLGTVAGPGAGVAAIIRLPGSTSRIAATVEGNGRFGQIDPGKGAEHSVAGAYRSLCAVGAEPVAVTNCMNFGNPQIPEVMWQFVEAVHGMGHACKALDTPITGGNVSFYNQTLEQAVYPTPVIGMIGILAEKVEPPSPGFVKEGDAVCLIGRTADEPGASEYQRTFRGVLQGPLPELDLAREAANGWLIREMISRGQILSAQPVSEGGLAAALSRLCIHGGMGAEITPEPGLDLQAWLFSETASRTVVALAKADVPELESLARNLGTQVVELGYVKGRSLVVKEGFEINVALLRDGFEQGFARLMD